jgi:hypothetical protein
MVVAHIHDISTYTLTNQQTESMDKSPLWEADMLLVSQILKESAPCSQDPTTCPKPKPCEFSACPPILFI